MFVTISLSNLACNNDGYIFIVETMWSKLLDLKRLFLYTGRKNFHCTSGKFDHIKARIFWLKMSKTECFNFLG